MQNFLIFFRNSMDSSNRSKITQSSFTDTFTVEVQKNILIRKKVSFIVIKDNFTNH